MFEKILVATDLSDASECVLTALSGLKQAGNRREHLVYCAHARDVGGAIHALVELAKPELEHRHLRIEAQGGKTQADINIGLPCTEIRRPSNDSGCSLFGLVAHGQNNSTDILLGGVARAVLHNASLHLLLIRLPCKGAKRVAGCEPWHICTSGNKRIDEFADLRMN